MATLAIDIDEIKRNLAVVLAIARDPTDWDADTLSDVERVIRSGRRKFFSAHNWLFLEEPFRVTTDPKYATGTIAVVDGVVTLSGGTFPTDAADYVLIPDSGNVYEIDTRDSGTQVTLHDTSVDIDAGEAYEIYRVNYPLPSNFEAFLGPLSIENSEDWEMNEIPVLPEWTVRAAGGRKTPRYDRPEVFSVFHTATDETGIITPFLTIYPIPDKQYHIVGRVRIHPGDSLAEAGDVCPPQFSELMMLAILSAGEKMYTGGASMTHTQEFEAKLPQYIQKDRLLRGTRRLRPRTNEGRHRDRLYHLKTATVEFRTD